MASIEKGELSPRRRRQRLWKAMRKKTNDSYENDVFEETVSLSEFPTENYFFTTGQKGKHQNCVKRVSVDYGMKSETSGTNVLLARTSVASNTRFLKKMASEPMGLTKKSSREQSSFDLHENYEEEPVHQKSPLEDFAILEELGDSSYGKIYRVKRISDGKPFTLKCISHQMRRNHTLTSKANFHISASSSMILEENLDAQACAVFLREFLACQRCLGVSNFLQAHQCWFGVYDLDDTPATPSLGQPFDLNRFSLDRFRNPDTPRRLQTDEHLVGDSDQVIDFEIYGNRLLTALMKEHGGVLKKCNENSSIMIVFYTLLDDFTCTLSDYLSEKEPEGNLEDKWFLVYQLLSILMHLYHCDLLHLNLNPSVIAIREIDSGNSINNLQIRLTDFGMNHYFETEPRFSLYSTLCNDENREYRSPEIDYFDHRLSSSHGNATNLADVYAFGLIMIDIFCQLSNEERQYLYSELRKGNYQSVFENLRTLPSEIEPILRKILSIDPEQRPEPCEIFDFLAPYFDFLYAQNTYEKPNHVKSPKPCPNMDRSKSETTENPEHATSLAHNICRLRLHLEQETLRANLKFRAWLNTVPNSLWIGVAQACARDMLVKCLDEVQNLMSHGHLALSFPAIVAAKFDYELLLGRLKCSADIHSLLQEANGNENSLQKATIWCVYRKYLESVDHDNEAADSTKISWVQALEDLYFSTFDLMKLDF